MDPAWTVYSQLSRFYNQATKGSPATMKHTKWPNASEREAALEAKVAELERELIDAHELNLAKINQDKSERTLDEIAEISQSNGGMGYPVPY